MRRIVIAVGVAAAAASAILPINAFALDARAAQTFTLDAEQREATRFVRHATGRLVIAPDGTATDISIEAGEARIEALYRRIIGTWRFAPVLRDGMPIAHTVDMNLTLSADRIEGRSRQMRYGVADVEFLEGTEAADGDVELRTSDLKPPVFPMSMAMAGVGARILVLLEVDASGDVTRAAVADATLFARQTSSNRAAAAQVERFAKATLDVVDQWTVANEDVLEAGWALVPVHFAMPGTTSMDWTPILPMTASPLDWMAEPLAEAKALSSAGRSVDDAVRLLTPMGPVASQ